MSEQFLTSPHEPRTVEERDESWIAEAVHYTATIHFDRRYFTVETADLAEAGTAASKLEAIVQAGGFCKEAMVYAVTALGHASLVPRGRWISGVAS